MREIGVKPKVSIIVPVYNIWPYLGMCIQSILQQTYCDFELILVDDGSNDGSEKICDDVAATDGRIKVIHQNNQGVVVARGAGISRATGEYIAFVDGDDWIEAQMIERMLSAIGNADVISAGVDWEEKRGYHIEKRDGFSGRFEAGENGMDEIRQRMVYDLDADIAKPLTTWMCNKLYHREILEQIYPLVDKDITFSEDTIFIYEFFQRCNGAAFIGDILYHYRYREDSACHPNDCEMPVRVGMVYSRLYKIFEGSKPGYRLKEQLHRWLLDQYYKVLNERTGVKQTLGRVLRYVTDTDGLRGKRVILYGAGRVGQDLYFQLSRMGILITAWVDRRAKDYARIGLPVLPVESIGDAGADCILIAVENEAVAVEIKKELQSVADVCMNIERARLIKLF